ncbi:hypothetical protein BU065_07360 [Staphylococcus succinus]|uniref:Uncharacterized protein n=1 Tax=Staphylococcus succinus TaxID=61015 RepID=A0A9Q6HN97_9STAP|nr:alkaline phosphatase [Staphylococcus succinus]MEB7463565.1 alkaline phosphatase [Staphylococcus succinus]PTI38993.1 hypothetical protein BU062_12260 [Staphylococcus succinus]PTI75117.1 hypothetical protein BU058_08845 [Staphylococcus succinus]PTJ16360.1 hypothetical protein BU069_09300 [Staphylococcus succinus]RIN34635.1 hypothetical protein BU065_07360 [Staphylococcus succinus]
MATGYKKQNPLEKVLTEPMNERSNTGWTSDLHVGHDTNIYGYGVNKEIFEGAMDNTEFNQNLFKQYKGNEMLRKSTYSLGRFFNLTRDMLLSEEFS